MGTDMAVPRQRGAAIGAALMLTLSVLIGIAAGIGGYTFVYANGLSYLSNDPRACVNCHIMQPQYEGWMKSSHHAVAGCVDCHLPHDFVGKYMAKALNGYHHSAAFTLQDFHEPIVIKGGNRRILQDNCVACHQAVVHDTLGTARDGTAPDCVHCHQTVGHGERAGIGGPER